MADDPPAQLRQTRRQRADDTPAHDQQDRHEADLDDKPHQSERAAVGQGQIFGVIRGAKACLAVMIAVRIVHDAGNHERKTD